MTLPRFQMTGARPCAALARVISPGSARLIVLAFLTGVAAGLGAIAFHFMIDGFTHLFSGHRDFSAAGHASNPLVPAMGGQL